MANKFLVSVICYITCHENSMRLFINNACNSKLTHNYPAHIQLLKLAFPVSGATKTVTGPELISS